MAPKPSGPQPLKELLNPILKRWADEKRPGAEQIQDSWKKVVGARAAQHSRPTSLRKGELLVAVESSVWLWNLSLKRAEYLEKLQTLWGPEIVRSVRLKIKPLLQKDAT